MFEKILVVATGDDSQRALHRALQCTNSATEIEILDVVYEPALEGYMGNTEVYEPLRRRLLSERHVRVTSAAHAAESWGVRCAARAIFAHPLDTAVTEEAIATGADLVVTAPALGTAGGLSHADWRLAANCPVPVLIVRSDGVTKYRNVVAAVDPFHTHAKSTDLDELILHNAKRLQQLAKADLTVLHCYMPLTYFGADLTAPPADDPLFEDGRRERLIELLKAVAIAPSAARLEVGAPHVVLKGMAERGEADVIVMGALARGRIKEALIGHTAERVLHAGGADVLVVKAPRAH
jgi:universal stress protein E